MTLSSGETLVPGQVYILPVQEKLILESGASVSEFREQ